MNEDSFSPLWFWLVFLILFTWADGWWRLDCALGVETACAHIQAKYE